MPLPLLSLIPAALQVVGLIGSAVGGSGLIPSLVGALAGEKAGEVAEKIMGVASEVFGTDDPKAIEAQIAADNNKAQLALKRLDQATEMYRIQVDDTKSARERDVRIQELHGGKNTRANVMLIGAFLYFIITTLGIIWFRKDIPGEVLAILNMSIGGVIGMLVQAFNFEFGSSRGSADKSNQLADMLSRLNVK